MDRVFPLGDKELRIGILGMTSGNGHPYSWSAMFNGYDRDEMIKWTREKYPTIHITAAISNISFNLPVRKMVNLGFTVLAMNAGLDSAILDPTNRDMMGVIFATEALLGLDDYCMEYIGAYREGLFGPKKD